MDKDRLRDLIEKLADGKLSVDEAMEILVSFPYRNIGYARIDYHRSLRGGFPEVIFCPGKTPEQVAEIFSILALAHKTVLATRADKTIYNAVKEVCSEAVYSSPAKCIAYQKPRDPLFKGVVLVCCAGTADIPVAEEAAFCAETMGNAVTRLFDVGVAGLHRLLDNIEILRKASVIIAVAGMEGALPSVVGGLTDKPVIAVPTSIGYGASFGGLAALLAMLNSCSSGIGVVNIDNGFGAAALATSINRSREDVL